MEVQRNAGASHSAKLGVAEFVLHQRGTHRGAVFKFYTLAADNRHPPVFLYAPVSVSQEFLRAENMLRCIDEMWRVILILPHHACGCCKPSGITPYCLVHHELIYFFHVAGKRTRLHHIKHVGPGCRSKAGRMVSAEEIIVNGLWNSHARQVISLSSAECLHPVYGIHGVIPADKEEPADVILLQDFKYFREILLLHLVA